MDLSVHLLQGGIEALRLAVFDSSPGGLPALFETMGSRAEVHAGRFVDSTILVATVVNPDIAAGGGKVAIGHFLPILPHLDNPFDAALGNRHFLASTALGVFAVRALEKQLGATLDPVERACREHHIEMRISFVAVDREGVRMLVADKLRHLLARSSELLFMCQG